MTDTKEPTKLSSYAIIESVDERFQDMGGTKDPATGESIKHPPKSLGWFIRLDGSSAVHVGMTKPPAAFVKGARVKHSIELAPLAKPAPVPADPAPSAPAAAVEKAMSDAGAPDFVREAQDKADAYRR